MKIVKELNYNFFHSAFVQKLQYGVKCRHYRLKKMKFTELLMGRRHIFTNFNAYSKIRQYTESNDTFGAFFHKRTTNKRIFVFFNTNCTSLFIQTEIIFKKKSTQTQQ